MENQKINVLFLDDEAGNLNAFKATFRKFYQIYTASTPEEAINILGKYEINVILIDQRMPELTGLEFLQLINQDFPYCVKILVSGYIDLGDSLDDAVKTGNVYSYITKPWTETEIKVAIEDAYKVYRLNIRNNKEKEFELFKSELLDSLKAPIANIEGLMALVKNEINEEDPLQDYFYFVNKSLETIKTRLNNMLETKVISKD